MQAHWRVNESNGLPVDRGEMADDGEEVTIA